MEEQFVNDFISKLNGKIADEKLSIIKMQLILTLDDYDVNKKCTDLIPAKRALPESYIAFMVNKKIEGASPNTLYNYKLYIEDMFLRIDKDIKDITTNDIRIYLYKRQEERKISNRSLDAVRSVLMSFFSWCAAENYINKNPMATIKPIKYEKREVKPLTDIELEKIRMSCSDIREKTIIEIFYATGCRVAELSRLNVSDINFDTMEVKLFGKGNKHRISYLNAKSALLLQEYLKVRKNNSEDEDALFTSVRYPHNRIQKRAIERVVRKVGMRVDIPELHCHQIRHTTATNALKRGVSVPQVQKLLGHSNINTTMIYAKVDTSEIKNLHSKYLN